MKVLVADNVKTFQQLVASLFENTGLRVVVASSGAQCLQQLEYDKFNFICISMHLEGLTGVELIKQIRETNQHAYTPIILLTSEESSQLNNQAMAAGVTGIFNKARDLDQLVAYIRRFSHQHQPIDGRILYVEDSRSLRASTTEILEQKGLQVTSFSEAEAAWEEFQNQEYDLVITDILLSGKMSGLGLVNNIRRMNDIKGDVPILAVTGFDDISRRIELFHMGVNDYATKPVVEEELIARIRYLIDASNDHERQGLLIESLFEHCVNGIVILDFQGNIEKVNSTFLNMVAMKEIDVLDKKISFFMPEDNVDTLYDDIWNSLLKKRTWHGKISLTVPGTGNRENYSFKIDSVENNSTVMSQYLGIVSEL